MKIPARRAGAAAPAALLAVLALALAAMPPARGAGPIPFEQQAARPYAIPAGPLSTALSRFAAETGLLLSGNAKLTAGKRSPGLHGTYRPEQALQRLLAGSGLTWRFDEEGSVTLLAEDEEGANEPLRLQPIEVSGEDTAESEPVQEMVVKGFRERTSSSATGVEAPLIETPATVNVLTRAFLDTISPRRLEDALAYIPGAGQEITFGNSDPVFNLRGFSTTGREGGIFVDGYQLNRRSYVPDLSLYERVDILKGTSGVLYGTARPGGVVNYVRKRPLFDESFARVEGVAGSFDTLRATLDATGQLSETLAYRLTGLRQEANQTLHGDNDDGVPDDRTIIAAALSWRTPLGGELRAHYEYYFIDQVFDPGIQLINGEWTFNREPLANPDQFSEREYNIFRAEYEQPLWAGWNAHAGVKYDTGDTRRFLDAAVTGALDGSPVDRFSDRTFEDYDQLELRLDVNGAFSTTSYLEHQLAAGINYFETDLDRGRSTSFLPGAIDPFAPDFAQPPALATPSPNDPGEAQDFEQLRLYAQDYITIADRLRLIAGVSYLDFEQRDGPARVSDSQVDFTIAGIFEANAWFNPYVTYSTSTQPQLGTLASGEQLPPREAEQIEIGLKSEWLGGRLASTLAVFEIEQTDKAESDPLDPEAFVLSGDERVRGLELELSGRLTPRLLLQAGYSYLDAEFSASVNPVLEGNTLPNIPEHKVSVFSVYERIAGIRGLSAGFGLVHVGDREAGNDNVVGLPSYTRGDAFLSYERGPWQGELTIENVWDEDYVAGTRPGFPSPNGTFQAAQGAPRFLTLTLGYEF